MMFYEVFGNKGKPLLLLHSGGLSGIEWKPQINILEKNFRVYVPDMLGHGKSLIADGEMLSIEKIGLAVIDLLDKEMIEKVNICGSSMGAAVVMWLLVNQPQRIDKAIIYRMTYHKNSATYQQTQQMADPKYWQQYGLQGYLSKMHEPQGGSEAWKTVIQRVTQALNPSSQTGFNYQLNDFKNIENEVLLVTGDRDPVAPLEDMMALFQTIKNCGLWVIPFASHITATNTWRSLAFAEEMIRFIGIK